MPNNLLFIGCLYSDLQKPVFEGNCKKGYQYAAQVFQESLIDGFLQNGITLSVMTIPSLGTFPLSYKSPVVRHADFIYKGTIMGKSLGFLTIPFLNHPCKHRINSFLDDWYHSQANNIQKRVVVYGMHKNLMAAAANLKKKHSDVNICIIVPDLPEFMACNRLYKRLGLKDRDIKTIMRLLPYCDSFTLLSKYMMERLPVYHKPYTVVEGIYSEERIIKVPKFERKTILYSGALSARYGILDLLEAFHQIPDEKYNLLLCGAGDAVSTVISYSDQDSRIKYLGRMSHKEVVSLQQRVTLLVNPRHSNELFTRYSFPSKTMEYMASGTPTLMCQLECLPDDYKQHLYFFEDESISGYREKMIQICEMNSEEREAKGNMARDFILLHKNARSQTKKILDLFD